MGDEQKIEWAQIVTAPGDLRAIDDRSFARRIRSRSEPICRPIKLGFEAEEWRRPTVAAGGAS